MILTCAALTLFTTAGAQEEGESQHVRKPLPTPEEIAKLPPDGGPEFNRLVFSQSPYLLQHARNPVDWYPWGEEAFRAAKEQDKPVFLSVGYSTCHWCHVMEHESFEDPEVAGLMNEHFICVKVDREERPDIDEVYMTVTQAMTGRGGWPMTVVMTPDKEPFFAGTYFPKQGRQGRPGMLQLVPYFSDQWKKQRSNVLAQKDAIMEALAQRSTGTPGEALDESTLMRAYGQLAQSFDESRGGFGRAPKFPIPHHLRFLLRYHARTGDARALAMALKTLTEMRKGGIWDHVGFGFHRYSTDAQWFLPHFEKMLYDQALLAMAYTEAWQVSGDDSYRRTAEEIFTYVLRDMTSPEGGFYSAEDADSEGEEGRFYVWTPEELLELLGEDDGKFAIDLWGVEPGGNFVEEAKRAKTGASILHLAEDWSAVSARTGVPLKELEARVESVRARLFPVREARIHPLKDDKVLTDWNGLMIAALAKSGRAFGEARYVEAARSAADFALRELRGEDGRLLKRYRAGQAGLMGLLEDYAFFAWGLIELFEASQDARYLEAAVEITDAMIAHFHDEKAGGFFLAPNDGEKLIVRSKEVYDGAIPSGNSVAYSNLLRLGRLVGRPRYEELAEETMKAFAGDIGRGPSSFTQFLCGLDFAVGPSFEVVIVTDEGKQSAAAMLGALSRPFLPNKVVVHSVVNEQGPSAVTKLAEYAREMRTVDGEPTAYVCRNHACELPTTDLGKMLEHLTPSEEE